jgi:hypothetical protein
MTGRRAGYCAGQDVPGYANDTAPRMGMGWRRGGGGGRGRGGGGWGRGGGRGYGRDYPVYPSRDIPPPAQVQPVNEVEYLEGHAKQLESDLKAIKERIKELKGK